MIDQGEEDDKIIAVHVDDPEYNYYESIDELAPHRMAEVKHFFEDYKALENKEVVVEDFLGREEAVRILNAAIELYKKEIGKYKI